jgi:hypothetical protein
MTKKISLIAIIALIASTVFSQQIEWGQLQKRSSRAYSEIIPKEGGDFYSINSSGAFFGSLYLNFYTNFNLLSREKLNYKTESGKAYSLGSTLLDGKYTVFLRDVYKNVVSIYYQQYEEDCTPNGAPILLMEFTEPTGNKRNSSTEVMFSKNRKFIRIQNSIPGAEKDDASEITYKIYDSSMTPVEEGVYSYEFESDDYYFSNEILTDEGDFYQVVRKIDKRKTGKRRKEQNFTDYSQVSIVKIEGDSYQETEIEMLDGKEVRGIQLVGIENGIMTFTGMYGTDNSPLDGLVYFKVDFEKEKITSEGSFKFTKEFIMQDFTDKEKAKSDKREAKGKDSPTLSSYVFNHLEQTKDGGIVAVMEQYYMYVTTTTDSKGNTTTTYHYVYNDLIVYKVNANGEFEWVKKMDKLQHTTNDGGAVSSVHAYVTEDKIKMWFNDSKKNYSETGEFIEPAGNKRIIPMTKSIFSNVVAQVEFDLSDGDETRQVYGTRKELGAIAVPKYFENDYERGEMFVYFVTKKQEKFGRMKF